MQVNIFFRRPRMMDTQRTFGSWLTLRRKALDLTREKLAGQVGCSAATIRKIEAEERRPSAQMVERLAEVLRIAAGERADFLRFARGDWQAAPGAPAETAPWLKAAQPRRANLPAPSSAIIGREAELAALLAYLGDESVRLVSLTGPPGIGKTRLSIEAAQTAQALFRDGVFFVALAALDDPSLVAPAVAQTLGMVETRNLPARQRLSEGIGDKQILLVLDDCESHIDAVAALVVELLAACAGLKILVTSREALRVPGEWIYIVPALAVPKELSGQDAASLARTPALALFAERARAVRAGFALNDHNLPPVAAICARLDGLPLALELIAARIRLMSPQDLLERLTGSFVLSADGMRSVPARQKTLNNAIGWSYNQLAPDEQQLFAGLAVFCGGFTLADAESVFSGTFTGRPISDLVGLLSDKSLLQRSVDDAGSVRFSMLVTIQQFGLERLRALGGESGARSRHLAYFLELAQQAEAEIHGPRQAEWGCRLEDEQDNLRAALEWCVSLGSSATAVSLLRALGWPWEVRGHIGEARAWFEKIRALPGLERTDEYAALLNHIGRHAWTQENYAEAAALLEESQAIALAAGAAGQRTLADTLTWLGLVAFTGRGERAAAREIFERSVELFNACGDRRGAALSSFHLGIAESDDAVALALFQSSLAVFHALGDQFFIARVSLFLGHIYLRRQDFAQARAYFERHLALDQDLQFWDGISDAWRDLGLLAYRQEDFALAEKYYLESLAACQAHGMYKFDCFFFPGLLALYRGDFAAAGQRLTQHLEKLRHGPDPDRTALSAVLTGLAAAAAGGGEAQRAARLSGAARAVRGDAEEFYMPEEAARLEPYFAAAREQMGAAAYAAEEAAGQALGMEVLVAPIRAQESRRF